MSKENTGLTRRRVLGGIVTVGAASAAVGAGTFAAFNDTETTDNTVTAGTLNLTAGGTDGSTFTVTVSDAKPGDDKTQATELVNDGSLGGSLDLKFSESTNLEGDDPEPEPSTTPNGDLGRELAVAISVGGTEVRGGTFDRVFDGTETDANIPLAAGQSKNLTIDWSIDSSVGNKIQGDSVSGDITIDLNQNDSQ